MQAAREAVWKGLERLPGWEMSRPSWRSEERLRAASAYFAGHLHRTERRPAVDASGATEAEALWELAAALEDAGDPA